MPTTSNRNRPSDARPAGRSAPGQRPRFNYVKRTAEQVNRQLERRHSRFDSTIEGVEFFRPHQGDNTVRILPPTWDNAEHYSTLVWEHRYIGANDSHYLCLQRMKGKRCPICEEERAARRAGDADEAKKLAPMERWYCYILDRNGDKREEPLVWNMNGYQDKDILRLTRDKKNAVIAPDDPDEGYDLSFERSGQSDRTRYGAYQFEREPSPAANKASTIDAIMDKLMDKPLPSVLSYKTEEYLERMLSGTTAEADEDLSESEAPRRSRRVAAADVAEPSDDEESPLPNDDEEPEEGIEEEEPEEEGEPEELGEEAEEVDEEPEEVVEPPLRRRQQKPEPEVRTRSSNGQGGRERLRPRAAPPARDAERRPSRYNRD